MHLPAFIRSHLQTKFLWLLLTILIALGSLILLVFVQYEINSQKKVIFNEAKAFSSLSVRPLGNAYTTYFDSGFTKFKEISVDTLSLDNNISRYQIIGVEGRVLYDSSETSKEASLTSEVLTAVGNDKASSVIVNGTTTEIIEPYFDDFGAHPFSIRYFLNYSTLQRLVLETLPLALLLIIAVALLGGFLVNFMVRRTILRPISAIVSGASEVSKGKLSTRIQLATGDELETLGQTVNKMASSLQKNIEDLKELDKLKDEFIIIASHNLRTPVTVIKGYLAQLESKKEEINLKEAVRSMTFATSQLEGLIEEFLNIVSLEKTRNVLAQSKIDLSVILKEVLNYYSKEAQDKKVSLNFESENNPIVFGDATKLKVLFSNLIENAIKFNKEKGTVKVSIKQKNALAEVSIADSGIGISEKEIPMVFKKFHRATDVLKYDYEGLGLGLYLARVITEAHGGKIWFESRTDEGSVFYVSLPIFDENSLKGGEV